MSKVSFSRLKASYPAKKDVPTDQLYTGIGHPELAKNMYWENTCAVRVSLALIGAGMIVPGHILIKAGRYKGRQIQPGQAKLSKYLAKPGVLGEPEKYRSGGDAKAAIGNRKGIVSFFNLMGATDPQGHIDIVSPDDGGNLVCGNSCYWTAVEVWFWPLK